MARKRTIDFQQRALWVENTLTETLGARPYNPTAYDPDIVGALIATILSQHTSDINSGRAFQSLKQTYKNSWNAVADAPVAEIADSIRSGGLANIKAQRIKALLLEIESEAGSLSLENVRNMNNGAAMSYLTSFHGVGPKTAACILMFNLGRGVIPVDTHVHRVAIRLGLVPQKTTAGQAQQLLLEQIGEANAYSFHVHLIEHGRKICHSQKPSCLQCPLREQCNYIHGKSTDAITAS